MSETDKTELRVVDYDLSDTWDWDIEGVSG